MCRPHWAMVPNKVRITIWNQYRPGQEVDKRPTLAYLAVQQMSVGMVAEKEGKILDAARCYRKSMAFLQDARASGEDLVSIENPEGLIRG